jgi:LmbE family N-acetylglucosaminyl deacetylase
MMHQSGPILVIVAHPDDEVLGCGGTMLRLAAEGREIHLLFLSEGVSSRYTDDYRPDDWSEKIEQREAMALAVSRSIKAASVSFKRFANLQMRHIRMLDIVKEIESHIERYHPVTIFTHGNTDMNSDHRIVCEAVLTACRPVPQHPVKSIYAMEISSSTEWNPPGVFPPFLPNLFVDISGCVVQKLDLLGLYDFEMRPYPHPRSLRAVENLARYRGATVGVEAAEAFAILRQIV